MGSGSHCYYNYCTNKYLHFLLEDCHVCGSLLLWPPRPPLLLVLPLCPLRLFVLFLFLFDSVTFASVACSIVMCCWIVFSVALLYHSVPQRLFLLFLFLFDSVTFALVACSIVMCCWIVFSVALLYYSVPPLMNDCCQRFGKDFITVISEDIGRLF